MYGVVVALDRIKPLVAQPHEVDRVAPVRPALRDEEDPENRRDFQDFHTSSRHLLGKDEAYSPV